MTLKMISVERLGRDAAKIVDQASRRPVLVRAAEGKTLVLRAVSDDDLADELLAKHPEFRASIRRAQRNRAAGKGIPLAAARRRLLG